VTTLKTRTLAAAIALAACGTAHADEWRYTVTPYVWATDIGIDVTVSDRQLVDASVPFEDLLEDLESGTLFRAEAMRGAHGIALDLFDVAVADDSGRVALPGGTGAELALDAEVSLTIFDLTGIYDPAGDGEGFAFLYGARLIEQAEDIAAEVLDGTGAGPSARYEADDRFLDALVGIRYTGALPGRWSYELSADASAGGTELTWSVNPSIAYSFGERGQYQLTAGYRYLEVDFDTKPAVDMDMALSGAVVGFRFKF
jgi:hypothetical protein